MTLDLHLVNAWALSLGSSGLLESKSCRRRSDRRGFAQWAFSDHFAKSLSQIALDGKKAGVF